MGRLEWMALGVTLAAASSACGYPQFSFTGAGGSGGGAGSGSQTGGGAAPSTCQVLHDTADCGASGRCTVVDETTGALGCVTVSSQPLMPYDACVGDHKCPAGTWCNPLTAVCSPLCATSQDCTPGSCIGAVDASNQPVPGVKVCTAHCSPDLVTPCGTGATCVYDPGSNQFDCATTSFVGQGGGCQQSSDCGPGLVCAVNASSVGSCLYWCEPAGSSSSDCLGAVCNSFGGMSPIVYDGYTFGYCTN